MKVLHTADWHLGQKFFHLDREEEHQLTLDWLLEVIVNKNIDLLIIAGDIFDITSPPNYAVKLYYDFFRKLLKTNCHSCVVIGGNHDSPTMLNAPKDLLDILKIKVIGAATADLHDEMVEIKNDKNEILGLVAAIPFLRERDLKNANISESYFDKSERIKEGIYLHYNNIAELCKKYQDIPIIATGHLYAKNAQSSEKQDNIYLGNIENISADQFPSIFDYVALGHIHRAQKVGDNEKIRYSGSIIPLSFSENQDRKSITIIDFSGKKIDDIEIVDIPSYRKLVTFRGSIDEIKQKLSNFDAKLGLQKQTEIKLRAWVELIIDSDVVIPNVDQIFYDFTKDMFIDILKIKVQKINQNDKNPLVFELNLEDLTPLDVFKKKIENVDEAMHESLITNFKTILEEIH